MQKGHDEVVLMMIEAMQVQSSMRVVSIAA
jgi:hypothetical protein